MKKIQAERIRLPKMRDDDTCSMAGKHTRTQNIDILCISSKCSNWSYILEDVLTFFCEISKKQMTLLKIFLLYPFQTRKLL